MIQASGVLRRLLLEARPLWLEANRHLRSRPNYERSRVYVNAGGRLVPMLWLDPLLFRVRVEWSPFEGQDVDELKAISSRTGDVDMFLKHAVAVAVAGDDRVTVKDLIEHYANKRGGVHHEPQAFEHELLRDLEPEYDRELQLTLVAIGRVVHRALEPLAVTLALLQESPPYGMEVQLVRAEEGEETSRSRHRDARQLAHNGEASTSEAATWFRRRRRCRRCGAETPVGPDGAETGPGSSSVDRRSRSSIQVTGATVQPPT